MTEGRDEDEWRKRITAKLLDNNGIILFDNIVGRLESSALSAALTCTEWEERILGKTAMVKVPAKVTWVATGNNPVLSNEMARRICRVRMDPKVDRPWTRDGFRHPDLKQFARAERHKLVWSCLTLIKSWLANGKPVWSGKPLGSFEDWSRIMGGIVENAGYTNFLGNLESVYEETDAEGSAWRQLIEAWWEKYGEQEISASDLYDIIVPAFRVDTLEMPDPVDIDLGDGSDRSQKTRLGLLLRKYRDRQFNDKRIIKGGSRRGVQKWSLKKAT
jgi:putative DNA primase/helicase